MKAAGATRSVRSRVRPVLATLAAPLGFRPSCVGGGCAPFHAESQSPTRAALYRAPPSLFAQLLMVAHKKTFRPHGVGRLKVFRPGATVFGRAACYTAERQMRIVN